MFKVLVENNEYRIEPSREILEEFGGIQQIAERTPISKSKIEGDQIVARPHEISYVIHSITKELGETER